MSSIKKLIFITSTALLQSDIIYTKRMLPESVAADSTR